MKWCFEMHLHIEAESRFAALLKASSAVLASLVGKDMGCEVLQLTCNPMEEDEQESQPAVLEMNGNIRREKMN